MGLKSIIITLSAIRNFTINLIPIKRASKQLFTRIDRFLMVTKVGISVEAEFRVILMAFTLLISCYFL